MNIQGTEITLYEALDELRDRAAQKAEVYENNRPERAVWLEAERLIRAVRDNPASVVTRTMKYAPEDAEVVLRRMFAKLAEARWEPVRCYDGLEWEKVSTVEEALDVIDSVEESVLKVKRGDTRHTIVLIPCNGEDVICDHSFVDGDPDGFAALMDSVFEES